MSFTMKVDMPNLPPGSRVQIHGLGVLQNGKTVKITDDQAEQFRVLNGSPRAVIGSDGKATGAVEFVKGPPLDKTVFPEGVTVSGEAEKKEVSS